MFTRALRLILSVHSNCIHLANVAWRQYLNVTSPPVLLGDGLPRELLVDVLPSFDNNVRLVDKFLPPAVLQHHLQLCEIILALQSTLIKQSPVSHNVAGGRFTYFSFGIARRPRRVWRPFISQVAYDGQVAFFTRHVSPPPCVFPAELWINLEEEGPLRLVKM